jgi:hypothetical protein
MQETETIGLKDIKNFSKISSNQSKENLIKSSKIFRNNQKNDIDILRSILEQIEIRKLFRFHSSFPFLFEIESIPIIGIYGPKSDQNQNIHKILRQKIDKRVHIYESNDEYNYNGDNFVILVIQIYNGRPNYEYLYRSFVEKVKTDIGLEKFAILLSDTENNQNQIIKMTNGDKLAKDYGEYFYSLSSIEDLNVIIQRNITLNY